MKTYKINGYEVFIEISRYSFNNSLALCLKTTSGENYAVLSVNIDESNNIDENQCFIDVNNCPWATQFIRENNLAEFTGTSGESGFCIYPLYDFSKFLDEYFKELYTEIKMPGNPRYYKIYQVGFGSYNFEITRADTHITLTANTEQMNKLQDTLNVYMYQDLSEEDEDE